jgi:DNA-3-methyladenine glycosylase
MGLGIAGVIEEGKTNVMDPIATAPLPRRFYNRAPELVAPDLIGKLLLRRTRLGLCGGRIVETEAYLPTNDPACHGARGPTKRNASIFGPPGHLYVYAIHAKWCLNAVTMPAGVGCAVLIRAIEPHFGIELVEARRPMAVLHDLARGPARLCAALDVNKEQDGADLTSTEAIWIAREIRGRDSLAANDIGQSKAIRRQRIPTPPRNFEIGISHRIGVTSAHDLQLRFYERGSPFVSGPKSMRQ